MREDRPSVAGSNSNGSHVARRVMLARALRDFGDGFVAVLLPVYLLALGHTAFQAGLIATVAAAGAIFGRAVLGQMDVPLRSSYVMAVVSAAERPAAASATAVPRSLAAAASPAIAGMLFAAGLQAWPLLICGGLKITYDLLLLAGFRRLKPQEEKRES